jgi:hypothetical protein
MLKILTPVFAGLSLLLSIPAQSLARSGQEIRPGGCIRTIEIEGKLGYSGNTFRRLPNGMLVSTLIGFPWEGYFVEVNGKKYVLDLPIGDEKAERLKGKQVRVSGVPENRKVGFPGQEYQMPFLRGATLKAVEEVLEERVYNGPSARYWLTPDTIFSVKSGDRRPMVEHIRALLGEDLKGGQHTLRVDGSKLVVRTTARNHARIREFLRVVAMIPGPRS